MERTITTNNNIMENNEQQAAHKLIEALQTLQEFKKQYLEAQKLFYGSEKEAEALYYSKIDMHIAAIEDAVLDGVKDITVINDCSVLWEQK